MEALRSVDEVAYVRFASVYRSFKDVDEFARELERLKTASSSSPSSPPTLRTTTQA
jgi:transcriptional repressor NrdR